MITHGSPPRNAGNGQTNPDRVRPQAFWARLRPTSSARWLIGFASSLVTKALERQKVEQTVTRYIRSILPRVALHIILIVAILGYFGVETTSFAARCAGPGCGRCGVGRASSNFAAGAFIVRAGCSRSATTWSPGSEVEGDRADDRALPSARRASITRPTTCRRSSATRRSCGRHSLGELAAAIRNRRVDLTAQLDHTASTPADAVRQAEGSAAQEIATVVAEPAPDVRDPDVQRARTRARGAPVLQHPHLTGGSISDNEPDDSRDAGRCRLSAPEALPRAPHAA